MGREKVIKDKFDELLLKIKVDKNRIKITSITSFLYKSNFITDKKKIDFGENISFDFDIKKDIIIDLFKIDDTYIQTIKLIHIGNFIKYFVIDTLTNSITQKFKFKNDKIITYIGLKEKKRVVYSIYIKYCC